MKKLSAAVLVFLLTASLYTWAQAGGAANLETVLNLMDRSAAQFHTVQTDFAWDQYTRVIDTHDYQKGTMYFRRSGKAIEMAADIKDPAPKYVLFKGTSVRVYEPRIDQVTEYDVGKNKADFQTFLVLGFGGGGHDLAKTFNLRYTGTEQVAGTTAYRLELVPKSDRVRNTFSLITLWIDRDRGISVQQKFEESSGDYRLAQYSNIKVNQKISDSVFALKTTGKTKTIKPQGS